MTTIPLNENRCIVGLAEINRKLVREGHYEYALICTEETGNELVWIAGSNKEDTWVDRYATTYKELYEKVAEFLTGEGIKVG